MYDLKLDHGRKLATATFTGRLTYDEQVSYLAELVTQTVYGPGWRTLVDLSAVEEVVGGTTDVNALLGVTDSMRHRFENVRVAVFATREDVLDMARTYDALRQAVGVPFVLEVFQDRVAAEKWLFEEESGTLH